MAEMRSSRMILAELPELAVQFAVDTWGASWCYNEAGSLVEFAALARQSTPVLGSSLTPTGGAGLEALSKAATPGEWYRQSERTDGGYGFRQGYDTSAICTDAVRPYGEPGVIFEGSNSNLATIEEEHDEDGSRAWDTASKANAELIVALVNAYRSGRLVEALSPTPSRQAEDLVRARGEAGVLVGLINEYADAIRMHERTQLLNSTDAAARWAEKWHQTATAIQSTIRALQSQDQESGRRGEIPDGWVLVPREPKPEMLAAFWRIKNRGTLDVEATGANRSDYAAYRAMLSAAPTPAANSGGEAPHGWQPIETAPQDGTLFWALEERRGDSRAQYICWRHTDDRSGAWYWQDEADSEPNPTHWRPLPTSPHPSKKETGDA